MKNVFTILFLLVTTLVLSQEVNQFDANGNRHGIWKKNFDNSNVIRYEGTFLNGKEIGLFKFYKNIDNKAVLTATKEFNETDTKAYVKFLASTGKVISEGQMEGKNYIGEWKYYQKTNDKLLTLENYTDSGILAGERFVYYPNEQIAEKQFYKNGKLNGVSVGYSDKNVVLNELAYVDDELHGMVKYYSVKGDLIVDGQYKNGRKDGVWNYYEDGKLTEEKDFTHTPNFIKKTP
jgi:antitoxin component YwqK of YwqJK toxin-antitoxin module